MVAQYYECTKCYELVHFRMAIFFMDISLCIFYCGQKNNLPWVSSVWGSLLCLSRPLRGPDTGQHTMDLPFPQLHGMSTRAEALVPVYRPGSRDWASDIPFLRSQSQYTLSWHLNPAHVRLCFTAELAARYISLCCLLSIYCMLGSVLSLCGLSPRACFWLPMPSAVSDLWQRAGTPTLFFFNHWGC